VKNLSQYGLVIADMVAITDKGGDIMTKFGRDRGDISYSMLDDDDEDDEDEEESDEEDSDRKLAKKIAKEEQAAPTGGRKSSRLAANASLAQDVDKTLD